MAAYFFAINVGQPRESIQTGASSFGSANIELRVEKTANGINSLEIIKQLKYIEDKVRAMGWPLP